MRLVIDLHKTPEDINTISCTSRGWFEVTTIHKMALESKGISGWFFRVDGFRSSLRLKTLVWIVCSFQHSFISFQRSQAAVLVGANLPCIDPLPLVFPLQIKIIIKCRGHNGPLFILQRDGIWAAINYLNLHGLRALQNHSRAFVSLALQNKRYGGSHFQKITLNDMFS